MKFSSSQIENLRIYTEQARIDPRVVKLKVGSLVDALMTEAERIYEQPGTTFDRGLIRSQVESLPWHLMFFKYLSECQSGNSISDLSPEEIQELKRIGVMK